MTITPFIIDDYDDMIALWERSGLPFDKENRDSKAKIENQLFDSHIVIYTLKSDDGRLIGSIIGSFDGRKGWINRLAIDPDFRGKKLGERLLEKAEETLADMGAEIISALIEDKNYPSMSLFRRCGYEGWDHILYFRKERISKE